MKEINERITIVRGVWGTGECRVTRARGINLSSEVFFRVMKDYVYDQTTIKFKCSLFLYVVSLFLLINVN